MSTTVSVNQLADYVGKEVGVSDWLQVDQARIDLFADATDDHQYIHVDQERAAQTPFGSTIAHGFLTLSLLVPLAADNGTLKLDNAVMGINYGLDKLRFISPVKAGSRIRARFQLLSYEEKKPKHYLLKHGVSVEIDGSDKPALVAEWLGMTVVG